jgi:hypothetical protein
MLNFNQFFNLLNGEPYETVPAPTSYNLGDYAKEITTSPVNNQDGENSTWALRPIQDEDMHTTSAKDVEAHFAKLKASGFNPSGLGPPMTDADLRRYAGQG